MKLIQHNVFFNRNQMFFISGDASIFAFLEFALYAFLNKLRWGIVDFQTRELTPTHFLDLVLQLFFPCMNTDSLWKESVII